MGYLHINNLYKDQTILMFRECYALEKIHGSSSHLKWNSTEQKLNFFSGGEEFLKFKDLFDKDLEKTFSELFATDVVIYGEVYGSSQQGMSKTYGELLKFICFDVQINGFWLEVPKAENVCNKLNIEFVDYVKVSTDIEALNFERDKPSTQAKRNGIVGDKIREGIILRPLIELILKNGDRLICKHKRDEFMETKTPREVNAQDFQILEDAKAISEEWVTEMRLKHVLDKLPKDLVISDMKQVISAMVEDVYREAKGEIIESKEVSKYIGNKTANLFMQKMRKNG